VEPYLHFPICLHEGGLLKHRGMFSFTVKYRVSFILLICAYIEAGLEMAFQN
jgi:succinylglutamate desuccinylase